MVGYNRWETTAFALQNDGPSSLWNDVLESNPSCISPVISVYGSLYWNVLLCVLFIRCCKVSPYIIDMVSRFSRRLTQEITLRSRALLSAAEDFHCSLWNAKVHYHACKNPTRVLSCTGWVQPTPPLVISFNINFNIIFSSMPRSSRWSLFNVTRLTRQFSIKTRVWKVVSASTLHMTAMYAGIQYERPCSGSYKSLFTFFIVKTQASWFGKNSCEHRARMMT
jgi:hypothetical protein